MLSLTLMEGFRLDAPSGPLALRSSAQRVVAVLALRGALPRSVLAGILWPDLPDTRASSNLRTVLWRLRQEHPRVLQDRPAGCSLARTIRVDVDEVRAWALTAIRGDEPPTIPPAQLLGQLLPEWDVAWLDEPRSQLWVLQLQGLEVTAERMMHAGKTAEAVFCAHLAISMEPLRESANRLLVEAYARQGNRREAAHQEDRFRDRLREATGEDLSWRWGWSPYDAGVPSTGSELTGERRPSAQLIGGSRRRGTPSR